MRRLVLAAILVFFSGSFCLAKDLTITPLSQKIDSQTKVFVGEIISKTIKIDPDEGSREELLVQNSDGKSMTFVLVPPIIIQDEDADPTIDTAEEGDTVFVLYNITADGKNDAEFIHTIE